VLQTVLLNALAVFMVFGAGILGWFLSRRSPGPNAAAPGGDDGPDHTITLNFWGQVFGYLCAALYILSRVPQLILNFRRKSTDGLSMLFFIFACLGNVTYVLSILAYEPTCAADPCEPGEAARNYGRYMLVNASWLAGSLLTLMLDFGVFAQYFIYKTDDDSYAVSECSEDEEYDDDDEFEESPWQRPLLARGNSTYG
jgi:hypothetical protein